MGNPPPANDPREIWQNQPTERSSMTLEEIRRKTQELDTKARREFFARIGVSLVLTAFCGWGFSVSGDAVPSAGYALAMVWSWLALHPGIRRMLSPRLAGDAALTTALQFYRGELERRRDYLRRPWLWFLGPILLAIGSFFLPIVIQNPKLVRNMAPFLVLLTAWIVTFLATVYREGRTLRREIKDLNSLENERR